MSDIKLCVNCRYLRPDSIGAISRNSRCGNPGALMTPHIVTGEQEQGFAEWARERSGACGHDARWFEPKEPQC